MNNGHNFSLPVALQVSRTVTRSFNCFVPDIGPLDIVRLGFIFQNKSVSSQLKISSGHNLLILDEGLPALYQDLQVVHLQLHHVYYITLGYAVS